MDEVDRAKFEERKAASKQILLLDAIGSMIAPTLLKDGQKIAKVGLLAYLESQRTARNVITVDPKKLPNPDEMTFV